MAYFIKPALATWLAIVTVAIVLGGSATPRTFGVQHEPPRLGPKSPAVQQAAQRAGKWLFAKQLPSGNWTFGESDGSYDLGATALAGLALVEAGIPTTHPSIQKAAQYLRTELGRKSSYTAIFTYDAATVTLFLDKLNEPGDAQLLVSLLSALRTAQNADGGWGYYVTAGSGADAEKQRAGSDNSNTQFAVIALLSGRDRITGVEDSLERAARRFLSTQDKARSGWGYKGEFAPSLSMTCAGLIAIGAAHTCDRVPPELVLGGAERQANLALVTTPVGRALATIERDLPLHHARSRELISNRGQLPSAGPSRTVRGVTVDYTTGKAKEATFSTGGGGNVSPEGWVDFYELWSVGRVAVAFNLESIGSVDWYTSGASLLIASQLSDGGWKYRRDGAVASTAFGLMFLGKANLAPAISTKIALSPGLNQPKTETIYRCAWTKTQSKGPAWRLTFSVASAEEYLRIVEKLGGTLVVNQGGAALKFDKPASDPKKSQRENWAAWERRTDVWQHTGGELMAELKEPLGVAQADRVIILLPNSVTRQVQSSAAKLKATRAGVGDLNFNLGTDPDKPLTADAINPAELRLNLQSR